MQLGLRGRVVSGARLGKALAFAQTEAAMPNHDYTTRILWTGNRGEGALLDKPGSCT